MKQLKLVNFDDLNTYGKLNALSRFGFDFHDAMGINIHLCWSSEQIELALRSYGPCFTLKGNIGQNKI